MAEVKINQLPTMASSEFTDNDYFLVVDDGSARLLSRPTFQAWVRENVQGEQGIQGVAGKDGKDGVNGVSGSNGKDGLSAYQVAVANGYQGTQTQWLQSLVGATGAKGSDGLNGWSPVLKTVARGNDVVLQISDWLGGSGTKPTTGQYLSSKTTHSVRPRWGILRSSHDNLEQVGTASTPSQPYRWLLAAAKHAYEIRQS